MVVTDEYPFDESATPEQNPDVDVDSLADPPSPDDFFLYSRIDGSQSVKELCAATGLGRRQTLNGLERLCEVGLVEIPGYEPPAETGGTESEEGADKSEESETDSPSGSNGGVDLSHLPTPPGAFEYDPELAELDVPLEDELRRELECLYAQIDELDHYQFFGVDRDAGRREIKKSYFELSKRYHPDKHFRAELGPYEEMLERIFQTITRAYRVLSNSDKRSEYDETLAEREAAEATPMSKPSAVRMASEDASREESNRSGERPETPVGKRRAAFAQLVKKGEKLRKAKEYVEAAEAYRKALSLQRDEEVAVRAARMLLDAGEHIDQAALFAKAALEIDEESTEGEMLLARALEEEGRLEAAIEHYDRVLEMEPDHSEARMRREQLS